MKARLIMVATKLGVGRFLPALLVGMAIIFGTHLSSAQRILHFTHTTGYDHNTREVSFAMFTSIGNEIGAIVDDDPSGDPFSDPAVLMTYNVIVFSNTSGAAILNASQRMNFENWVANGGRVLGIHAATDTYRHSTANGSNTGTWDYYAELIGASVQMGPNHVSGTPQYTMSHIGTHASTVNLPDPWVKNEEYYYWEGGYFGPDNSVVLEVEETVGPNGQVNSYDAARPVSWYRELVNGSRVFYTSLGHAQSNYTTDQNFRTHIRDALIWLLELTTVIAAPLNEGYSFYPNPATSFLNVHTAAENNGAMIAIKDAQGQVVLEQSVNGNYTRLDLNGLAPGNYVLTLGADGASPFVITR